MTVSARTYQVLHSLRILAQADKPTTSEGLNALWREKKKQDKVTYDQTYISPSAQDDLLRRLVMEEGLLTRDGGSYHLTPKGSNLADMIDKLGVDTCTSKFINDYKAQMAMAALLSSLSGKLTVGEVSTTTLLSGDSARRGLNDLLMEGKVTLDKGVYSLVPTQVAPAVVTTPVTPKTDPVASVLGSIDETPMTPFESPVVQDEPPTPGGDCGTCACPCDHDQDNPDFEDECEGHECEDCPHLDFCHDEDDEDDEDSEDGEYDCEGCLSSEWMTVNVEVRERFSARATAMGISLADYMAILDESFVEAARQAFLPPGQFVCMDCGCGCGEDPEGEPKKG